jgi:hypothetical protein
LLGIGAAAASHFAFFHQKIAKKTSLMRHTSKTIDQYSTILFSSDRGLAACKKPPPACENEPSSAKCEKFLKDCKKFKASAELSDSLSQIFQKYDVPIKKECIGKKKDKTAVQIVPKCPPPDKKSKAAFWKEVSAWNVHLKNKRPELGHVGPVHFVMVAGKNSAAALYQEARQSRNKLLLIDAFVSLTAAIICIAIARIAKKVLLKFRAENQHKRIIAALSRMKSRKSDAEQERPLQNLRTSQLTERPAEQTAKTPKKVKPPKQKLRDLDALLEERFGIVGVAATFKDALSRKRIEQLLAEPRGIYYLIRDNRAKLEQNGFDTEKLMRAVRNAGAEVPKETTTETACHKIDEPDYESILSKCQFTEEPRNSLDSLSGAQRKSLLRRLWEYDNGLRPPRTYPTLGSFLGLNFSTSGRVLFINEKASEELHIIFISMVHDEYMKFLKINRKNKGKLTFRKSTID